MSRSSSSDSSAKKRRVLWWMLVILLAVLSFIGFVEWQLPGIVGGLFRLVVEFIIYIVV